MDLTTAPSPSLTATAAAIAATTSPLMPASTLGAGALAFLTGAGAGSYCSLLVTLLVFPFFAFSSALETTFPNK